MIEKRRLSHHVTNTDILPAPEAKKRLKLSTTTTTTSSPPPPPSLASSPMLPPSISSAPEKQSILSCNTKEPHISQQHHPQSQSLFFRLPWELRSLIYRLAITKTSSSSSLSSSSSSASCHSLLDHTRHDDISDLEPALLLSCRRTRQEALPLFYGCNDWVVKTRRVNNRRIDPQTHKPVLWEIVPRWVECLPDHKLALIARLVVVGTRGSYVDVEGRWREGGRAAFEVCYRTRRGKIGYEVEEIRVRDYDIDGCNDNDNGRNDEREEEGLSESFCGVRLVDLLGARMKCLAGSGTSLWSKKAIHEIACLL